MQYKAKTTGWDLGLSISPIKKLYRYFNKDIAILIPGCGEYMKLPYLQGFTNVTVIDIAPTLVKNIEQNSLAIPAYRCC
jgi:hypothetical protein